MLLTRARLGMVIWGTEGGAEDEVRGPRVRDGIATAFVERKPDIGDNTGLRG